MDNSKKALLDWMLDALNQSSLSDEEQRRLSILGQQAINLGGWRGDITTIFKNEGYTTGDIPNLYP